MKSQFGVGVLALLASLSIVPCAYSYCTSSGGSFQGNNAYCGIAKVVTEPREEPAPRTTYKTGYSKTSIAYPTGRKDSSILWIEKIYPNTVNIGKPYTYTINVTNLTNLSVPNVVITEHLPAGFQLQSSDPVANIADGKMEWALGKLNPRETRTISVTGMTNEKAELPCCTAASYDPPTLCVNTSVVRPDLKLDMTAAEKVTACQGIPLDFVVTNPGDAHITDVKITSQLPDGVTVRGNSVVTFNVGGLNPGAFKKYSEMAQAHTPGSYKFSAAASASDGLSANAEANTTVVKPVLTITANAAAEKQYIGRNVSYSVTVSNTGNATAESTVLNASLEGVRGESASDNGSVWGHSAKWDLGALEPGANKTVSIQANATDAGVAKLDATAKAKCSEDVSTAASTNIVGIPAILLEMVDLIDPIEIGKDETYVIKITNQGSASDTNIKIVAILDDSEEYVSSSGPTDGTASGKTVTFAPLAKIDAKDVAEWKVVVRGVRAADARFKVSLTSDQLSAAAVEKTESTTIY